MVLDIKDHPAQHISEPLSADCFTMVVDIVRGKEYRRVTVPGVDIRGGARDFVSGVYWGRDCYVLDVFDTLDQEGNAVHEYTSEELEQLREVKVRDITVADVVKMLRETMEDREASLEWCAGLLFGYVAGCAEQFYGLVCEQCTELRGKCECQRLQQN